MLIPLRLLDEEGKGRPLMIPLFIVGDEGERKKSDDSFVYMGKQRRIMLIPLYLLDEERKRKTVDHSFVHRSDAGKKEEQR